MRYPEMVVSNARYRGPMESFKQSASVRDIERSIALLQQQFAEREKATRALMGEVLTTYNYTIPDQVRTSINQVKSVKGGEL